MTTVNYTPLIGLALPTQGDLSGTWGDTVNNYISTYVDSAVAGTQTISGSQTAVTLSVTNGVSLVQAGSGSTGSSQYSVINCTGNPASLLTITVPAASKSYLVINSTSTSQSVKVVGAGPTTGVTLIATEKAIIAWNGSDFVKVASTSASAINSGTLAVAYGGTGLSSIPATSIPVANTANTYTTLAPGAGQSVRINSGGTAWEIFTPGTTSGTVVGVSGTPPIASSGGTSPVISLNASYGDTQNPYASKTANYVLAAPNGSSGAPTFRAIVAADIPTLNQNTTGTAAGLSATLAVGSGGTGLTSIAATSIPVANTANVYTTLTPAAGQSVRVNSGGTAWEVFTPGTTSGTVVGVSGTPPIVSSGGTSPAISLAANYGDTQNPYASKTANYVLAAPNGSSGVPTFRAVVAADIPTLNQNTTGSAGSVANTLTISSPLSGTSFNGSSATTIALASNYGDTQNPYASKTANFVLAAPNGSTGVPTFRAIVAADIPTLNQNTTGTAAGLSATLGTNRGGTNLTSFTNNGVVYASGTNVLATGSVLTFDGAQLTIDGINAGRGASSVSTNTVFGASALTTANSFSLNNTAIGYGTINTITNAIGNTALGYNALNLTTGSYNTCIGRQAGSSITTGGSNTIIGFFSGVTGDFDIRTRNSFVVLADGSGGVKAVYNADGVPFYVQPTPTSKSTTATLTGAEVLTQILNTTGSSYNVTMPTGTDLQTAIGSLPTDMAFDFTVVNTASGTITMVVNTGITAVGSLSVPTGTSATYKIRKTASNTFVMYRT